MGNESVEQRRQRRARKPAAHHAREREASRRRMAAYRAKNRAQALARQLKPFVGEGDRSDVAARSSALRHRLYCEWFDARGRSFRPAMVRRMVEGGAKVLGEFVAKMDVHRIELRVAEFEVSALRKILEGSDAIGPGGDWGTSVESKEEGAGAADPADSRASVGRAEQAGERPEPALRQTVGLAKKAAEEGDESPKLIRAKPKARAGGAEPANREIGDLARGTTRRPWLQMCVAELPEAERNVVDALLGMDRWVAPAPKRVLG